MIIKHLLYTLRCIFIYEYGKPPKPNNRMHSRTLITTSPKTPNPRSSAPSQPYTQSFRLVQWPSLTLQEIQLSSYPSQILKSRLKIVSLESSTPNEASIIKISSSFIAKLRIWSSWQDGRNERIQLTAKKRELRTTEYSF
jgi:hypothetical protein